jgi:hypothetical protein
VAQTLLVAGVLRVWEMGRRVLFLCLLIVWFVFVRLLPDFPETQILGVLRSLVKLLVIDILTALCVLVAIAHLVTAGCSHQPPWNPPAAPLWFLSLVVTKAG